MFLARLVPLARTFVSLPAGARHVRLAPFIVLTTLGCAIWATALVLAGLMAGAAWTSLSSTLGRLLLVAGVCAISFALMRGRSAG